MSERSRQVEREARMWTPSVEEILRPLAERMLKCPMKWTDDVTNKWTDRHPEYCELCKGANSIPDPRFEALRRPIFASDYVSGPGIMGVLVDGRPWTLDASLGAIVRAAAACGWAVRVWRLRGAEEASEMPYRADVTDIPRNHTDPRILFWAPGATPEEAAARALAAAVEQNS